MTELIRIAHNRDSWRAGATAVYRAGEALIEAGKPVKCVVCEWEDDISARQRGFLHGAVLTQISEQARGPQGERYRMEVWKELYRAQFLGSAWEMFDGKPIELRNSTEGLGVKAYSEYIDRVIADAATEWGVVFRFIAEEREAVRYKAPVRAKRKEAEEVAA